MLNHAKNTSYCTDSNKLTKMVFKILCVVSKNYINFICISYLLHNSLLFDMPHLQDNWYINNILHFHMLSLQQTPTIICHMKNHNRLLHMAQNTIILNTCTCKSATTLLNRIRSDNLNFNTQFTLCVEPSIFYVWLEKTCSTICNTQIVSFTL